MSLIGAATAGLDDILDELRLKYDSLVGLLDGDAVRELPSLNTLLNLNKLLAKLAKSLDVTEAQDSDLVSEIDVILAKRAEEQNAEAESSKETEELAESKKRGDSDLDDEESIPLAKRPKREVAPDDAEESTPLKEESSAVDEVAESNSKANSNEHEDGDLESTADKTQAKLEEAAAIDSGNGSVVTEPEVKKEEENLNSKDDPVPPEQTGSFTPQHDSRLKNPHSEFVTSQSLSASAIAELGLFSEEHNGLETQGKEYLKKKFGVASYPENDLKLYLPGEIPDMDFSKTKVPQNQVQFTTYQTYIESYFRPFSNEDITFANEDFVIPPGFEKNYDPLVTPYLIPKLGDFYVDVWGEEDVALGSKLSSPATVRPPIESFRPKGDFEEINDEKLLTEDVSCGPLSNRLLSAIMSVHECKSNEGDDDKEESESDIIKKEESSLGEDIFSREPASKLDSPDTYKTIAENNDFYSMEERLKRELKYIGIFMNLPSTSGEKPRKGNVVDSEDWILNREDDEICFEIRSLQEELKGAVVRNRRRKKALLPILKEHLAYQEYCTIAEDLDKQVDQAYIKRLKAKSKKKKTITEPTSTPQQQAANSGLKSLLDKRNRWITNIGKVFKAPEVMKRIASKSIFTEETQSDDEDAEGEVEVGTTEEAT